MAYRRVPQPKPKSRFSRKRGRPPVAAKRPTSSIYEIHSVRYEMGSSAETFANRVEAEVTKFHAKYLAHLKSVYAWVSHQRIDCMVCFDEVVIWVCRWDERANRVAISMVPILGTERVISPPYVEQEGPFGGRGVNGDRVTGGG